MKSRSIRASPKTRHYVEVSSRPRKTSIENMWLNYKSLKPHLSVQLGVGGVEMYESEVSLAMNEVDIRFEKNLGFTVATMNTEGKRFFAGIFLVNLLVSGIALGLITQGFENISSRDALFFLLMWGVSSIMNAGLFIPLRAARGNICSHCQKRMPELYNVSFCDCCEKKFGFSKAEEAARKTLKENLTKWYASENK